MIDLKLRYLLFLGASMLLSCSESTTELEGPENPDIINPEPEEEDLVINLSESGLANCYIVQSAGKYKFVADNRFNLGEGLPVPPEISPVKAGLIWQTIPGSITDVELNETDETLFVNFEVKEAKGNALLAVYNDNDEIQWSWHIWMPTESISSVSTATGYEVMNMNLGAMNNIPGDPESYGMLYQWGRKDPFPASATLTGDTSTIGAPIYDGEGNVLVIANSDWSNSDNNTLKYSIANPTICLSNYSQYSVSRDWLKVSDSDDSLWGNPYGDEKDEENNYINQGKKTCYDPSPAGWRVAPADVFLNFTLSGGYAWDFDDFNIRDVNNDHFLDIEDYNYGWEFYVNDNSALYFPAASRFDGSYAMLMGSMSGVWGNYWSNSPYSDMSGGAICVLAFQVKDMNGNEAISVSPSGAGSRADAYSIRCIRDN